MGDTWESRAELAGREGLALLFLAEEGWETHGTPELSWRIGRGWPEERRRRRTLDKNHTTPEQRVGNNKTIDFSIND